MEGGQILSLLGLACLLVNVLLVQKQDGLEVVEILGSCKLVQRVLRQRHLVKLCALLLQLFVLVADHLALLLELIAQQVLQVLPQIDHLARAERGPLLPIILLIVGSRRLHLLWAAGGDAAEELVILRASQVGQNWRLLARAIVCGSSWVVVLLATSAIQTKSGLF